MHACSDKYGGPVGHGCYDVHVCDLRTCTYSICGRAHVHICVSGKHVATTWLARCNHVETIARLQIAYVHVRKSKLDVHVCTSINHTSANRRCACEHARPQIAYVHVRKSQMCMCMCTSANRNRARHKYGDLPGHRTYLSAVLLHCMQAFDSFIHANRHANLS